EAAIENEYLLACGRVNDRLLDHSHGNGIVFEVLAGAAGGGKEKRTFADQPVTSIVDNKGICRAACLSCRLGCDRPDVFLIEQLEDIAFRNANKPTSGKDSTERLNVVNHGRQWQETLNIFRKFTRSDKNNHRVFWTD